MSSPDYGFAGYDLGGYDDVESSFPTGWTGTGDGMYVLPGEGGGERADTGLTVPTDDSGYIGETGLPPGVTPGTPGPGWGNAGNWGTFLTDLDKSGIGGALKGLFGGKYGDLASMLAFMGLSGVANQSKFFNPPPTRVGYQGGIPQYIASRTQTPMEQQRPVSYESITPREGEAAPAVMRPVPYRPGQGGITYFNPIQYNYTGRNLAAPTLAAPATGGTTGGSNVGIDTGGSVATPGYTGPVVDTTMPVTSGIGGGLGSISDSLGVKTGSTQTDQNKDYGQYGFDPALVNYLNQQKQMSVMDAGIDWTYDPSSQTFSGASMSGPLTSTLAEMKAKAGIGAARGGYMPGGIAMLAGGRYLRGPGDGVSDSIPARFERSGQPARLADGEFVIPARVVSEIGNGSSDAGARKLYAMLDRVERRAKASKRGKPSGADKELNKLA